MYGLLFADAAIGRKTLQSKLTPLSDSSAALFVHLRGDTPFYTSEVVTDEVSFVLLACA